MFKLEDLWKILDYLKDGTIDPRLDVNTKVLSESERQVARDLFTNTIDQPVFNTNDYKKLRKFIIDWYASHRTVTTTQKNLSDVFSIPDDHVNELFRSFGYTAGLTLVPLVTKVNLFLDLVNLYKKKGTPEALIDILDYYGFTDADLIEYWLLKNESGNLVFRGENVRPTSTGSTTLLDNDVDYDVMTGDDPHWILTEAQAESLISSNKINIPSKSPYFSLSSIFSLEKLTGALSIVSRKVQDQYQDYLNGVSLPQDVTIKNVGYTVSLLEAYLAAIYGFETHFSWTGSTSDLNFLCFNDTDLPNPLYEAIDGLQDALGNDISYNYLTNYTPTSRADRKEKLETFATYFTRSLSTNFLNTAGISGTLLNTINPSLKAEIDTWFFQALGSDIITYLLGTIDIWIRKNVTTKIPSIVITMLGFGFRDEVKEIINFFKPYRARLAFIDTTFSIDNPLTESVILEDLYNDVINEIIIDMPKAGGADYQYDTGAYYDIGIVNDALYEYITIDPFASDTEIVTDLFELTSEDTFSDSISVTDDFMFGYVFQDYVSHKIGTDEEIPGFDGNWIFDCAGMIDIYQDSVEESLTDSLSYSDILEEIRYESHTDTLTINDSFYVGFPFTDTMIGYSPDSTSLIQYSYTTDATAEIDYMLTTGGFINFDEDGAIFDANYGKDVCEIYVNNV